MWQMAISSSYLSRPASRRKPFARSSSAPALPKYRKQPHAKVQAAGMDASKAS
jgi:hypothetical protein